VELRHLRYFVAVAEELNFSRAAQRLAMTQPSLSRQVHDLENELGVELLARQPRRLLLTPAGEIFLDRARQILEAAEQAVFQTRQLGQGVAGTLAIGYNTDQAGCGLLPAILQAFRQEYPDVTISLRSMEMSRQLAALHDRELDLGFSIRLGKENFEPGFKGICNENLSADPLVAALPAGHKLAENEKVSLAELAAQPFIWSSGQLNPRTGDYTPTLFEEANFLPQKFISDLHRNSGQLALVGQGVGVSLAHPKDTRPPGVVFRPLAEEFRGCHTLFWSCANASAALRAFIELAKTTRSRGDYFLHHF
jgi:DNA-binding transcriptional LysR family regulator